MEIADVHYVNRIHLRRNAWPEQVRASAELHPEGCGAELIDVEDELEVGCL